MKYVNYFNEDITQSVRAKKIALWAAGIGSTTMSFWALFSVLRTCGVAVIGV